MRFAGAGWALDDQGASGDDFGDGDGLRAVGIDHMVLLHRRQLVVDAFVVMDDRFAVGETVAQNGGNQAVVFDAVAVGPVFRVEVAVHQELREGEEAQYHGVGQHFPARMRGQGLGDLGSIGGQVDGVFVGKVVDDDAEIGLHLGLERQVG